VVRFFHRRYVARALAAASSIPVAHAAPGDQAVATSSI